MKELKEAIDSVNNSLKAINENNGQLKQLSATLDTVDKALDLNRDLCLDVRSKVSSIKGTYGV